MFFSQFKTEAAQAATSSVQKLWQHSMATLLVATAAKRIAHLERSHVNTDISMPLAAQRNRGRGTVEESVHRRVAA